jgi:hypothetical protein
LNLKIAGFEAFRARHPRWANRGDEHRPARRGREATYKITQGHSGSSLQGLFPYVKRFLDGAHDVRFSRFTRWLL